MGKKIKIKVRKPWIAYPGSTIQQNYSEELRHGYLLWDIANKDRYDVSFQELPNPQPFVTIEWQGSVAKTVKEAKKCPNGSRFRIKCDEQISQKHVKELSNELKNLKQAVEITYKIEDQVNTNVIDHGGVTIFKEDLRDPAIHMQLLRKFYTDTDVKECEWAAIEERVKQYLNDVVVQGDVVRNAKWTIKSLEFDNLFTYGEGNTISFESVSGITGIFGANRVGKSSIVGALMYALFNTTDRGPIKNQQVVNVRKPHGVTKIRIGVDGCDYTIERQTVKHENRRGEEHGVTSLNIWRHNSDGTTDELNGEQRNDTEKVIRKLIGTGDDFMLTSLSTQGNLASFINEGSTQRKMILSRFLDLDVFDRMFALAKDTLAEMRYEIRGVPDVHWDVEQRNLKDSIKERDKEVYVCETELFKLRQKLKELQVKHHSSGGAAVATEADVDRQQSVVKRVKNQVDALESKIKTCMDAIAQAKEKLSKIDDVRAQHSIDDLKRRYDSQQAIEKTLLGIKHDYERELTLLQAQEKSVKKLLDVPCGEQFPTCKFIKDSHQDKQRIAGQKVKVEKLLTSLDTTRSALNILKEEKLDEKIKKLEQIASMHTKLQLEISTRDVELVRHQTDYEQLLGEQKVEKQRLESLEEALKNSSNSEEVALRKQIENIEDQVRGLESKRLSAASAKGRLESQLDQLAKDRERYDDLHERLHVQELITNAFSKRGIPNQIITSQLPVINAEIAKILHGITDFTLVMESDVESNSMDVYLDYGDSRRIIELGSGMEKTIASIAIRVALLNVTSLPRPDVFIIDEGFGTLDATQVEACNRFLLSLKKIFRSVLVITHVDAIKDVADNVIEVTRIEKDSRVVYN